MALAWISACAETIIVEVIGHPLFAYWRMQFWSVTSRVVFWAGAIVVGIALFIVL
eukprot:SAG31_NODE_27838_length_419_cov_1.053125_1_plen_54_part_01